MAEQSMSPKLAPELAYVALASRDPGALGAILEQGLGLPRRDEVTDDGEIYALFGIGGTVLAVFGVDSRFLGGSAVAGVHHLAVSADNPVTCAQTLGIDTQHYSVKAGLGGNRAMNQKLEQKTNREISQAVTLASSLTGGTATRLAPSVDMPRHDPGVVERIDHIGIASADNKIATAFFVGRLGAFLESDQTDLEVQLAVESFTSDKYGVVYHNRAPQPVAGLRVRFITIGDCELELLQPFNPADPGIGPGINEGPATQPQHNQPGNTAGDKGAIGRYLTKRGPGLHHLALKTPDIDALLAQLRGQGIRLIDDVGRPGSRRARIGFIHPGALGGVLLHFVERDEL